MDKATEDFLSLSPKTILRLICFATDVTQHCLEGERDIKGKFKIQ